MSQQTSHKTSNDRLVRFLLVEDDEDHAALVKRSLTRSRIANEVQHVADGVMALKYLRGEDPYTDRRLPDVVLLDLNLPKLSGHDVLAAIRSERQLEHLPIVILTTSDAETDRAMAYEHHANSYVVKPLDFSQFRKLVDDLSLYWGVWNRPPPVRDD